MRRAAGSSRPSAARACASVWRTVQPSAAAVRASRRRSAWSDAISSARPWPSVSVPVREQVEHLVGQVEQPQQVRDRDARAADAAADVLAREPELLDEQRAGARLLDRVEVLAGHVLDQRELERLGVVVRRARPRARARSRRAAPRASGARRRSARRCRPGTGAAARAAGRRARAATRPARAAPPRRTPAAAGAGSGEISSTGISRSSAIALAALGRRDGRGQDRGQAAAHAARALSHGRPPPSRARSTPPSRRSAGRGG